MIIKNISLLALLLPSAWLDIKQKKIWLPWLAVFFLEAVVLMFIGVSSWRVCLVGMIPGVLLIIISLISQGAIGLGDGYLVCVIGSLTGLERVMIILTGAMLISAATGMFLIIFRHWGRKSTLPFVPFLLIAFILQINVM